VTAALLVNAAALAATYTLIALGFVLVLNAVGAVNFAHGELVMAGGFMGVLLAAWLPLPGVLLLPLALVPMAALGLLVGATAYRPIADRPPAAVFVSTIAVGIVLQNGALALFGAAPRTGPALWPGAPLDMLGIPVGRQQAALILAALALAGGTALLLGRTQFGRRLRASAEDRDMARAIGIDVDRMTLAAFALAAVLAGAAGMLLSRQYFVTPGEGGLFMLKAYIAATIGGWGRIGGAVAGAVLIAAFDVLVAAWVSQIASEALLYGAVLAVMMIRPQGLFGEAAGRRA
jgi:branched-chain amino acid transport system permease protein